jgi:RNA polymerase sigma-70 factor (ECF subfamily)
MVEDNYLIRQLRNGSPEALGRIYEKYHRFLLTLATALLNDVNTAEDAIHDFFVSFARTGRTLKLEGSLKAYLATCVANRARDRLRAAKRQPAGLERAESIGSTADGPASTAVCNETLRQVNGALAQLPYEQREAVILHTRGGMKFKMIAAHQNVSTQTVQSRYRYGLEKLTTLLNGQVAP